MSLLLLVLIILAGPGAHAAVVPAFWRIPAHSIAVGRAFGGRLLSPSRLPAEGPGFRVQRPQRGRNYGTEELILGLEETAARMQRSGSIPMAIGDISSRKGGRLGRHLSHQNGRDADIGFYALDRDGKPVDTGWFVRFDKRGLAIPRKLGWRFDTARNWTLVKNLLTESHFGERVQFILVAPGLRALLLAQAELYDEDPALLARAVEVLKVPGKGLDAHNGHLHMRIGCSDQDRRGGCHD